MGYCKEEQFSDEEFGASISVVENIDKAWYPSECLLENWNEADELAYSSKEEFKQGHYLSTFHVSGRKVAYCSMFVEQYCS